MATTRLDVRDHIQEILGNVNPSEPVIGQFRYNEVINRNMHAIAARCDMPRSSVASVALVASTFEYTVASTTAQSVGLVILNSIGRELGFVPWEQFNAYYRQDSAQPLGSGTPEEYTLREDTSNLLRFRFGPTPSAIDTVKVHLSILPATLATDTSAIPFAIDLVRALELSCACEIVLAMDKTKLGAIGLAKDVAAKWDSEAARIIHDYNVRMGRLGSRQNHILRYGGRRVRVGV